MQTITLSALTLLAGDKNGRYGAARKSNLTRDVEYCILYAYAYTVTVPASYSTMTLNCDLLTPKLNVFISLP